MVLYNENYELISQVEIDAFKKELELTSDKTAQNQGEIEADLEKYYVEADQIVKKHYGMPIDSTRAFLGIGKGLLKKIKDLFCRFMGVDSTASEIIDKILEALASFIPGGVFIKWLASKIIRYFLNMGYNTLCPAA
jgi:hypothetical protein